MGVPVRVLVAAKWAAAAAVLRQLVAGGAGKRVKQGTGLALVELLAISHQCSVVVHALASAPFFNFAGWAQAGVE